MRLGFIAQGGPGWAGGSEYIRNLARAVRAARKRNIHTTLLCGTQMIGEWRTQGELFDSIVEVGSPAEPHWTSRWWPRPNAHFSAALDRARCEVLYPLTYDNNYNLGVQFPLAATLHDRRWLGWIPDFQHLYLPELFGAVECSRREKGIRRLLAENQGVVLSSESALEDFRRHYPEHAARGAVLRFGTHPEPAWYTDYEGDTRWLPPRFFAVCNQFWKHKNHALVFEALHLLAGRGIRPIVLCTGQMTDFRDPDYLNGLMAPLYTRGIASQVWLLGRVERRLQIELMRRALAIVQPSRFEGWSTVVEDARVLGRPCLLSDIAVHREQDPPGARFFPIDDPETLAAHLAEVWENGAPGPDRAAEEAARALAEKRIASIGARMVRLARAARDEVPLATLAAEEHPGES